MGRAGQDGERQDEKKNNTAFPIHGLNLPLKLSLVSKHMVTGTRCEVAIEEDTQEVVKLEVDTEEGWRTLQARIESR